MNRILTIVMTLALLAVVGCGTWKGLGKDIGRTGDAMSGEKDAPDNGSDQPEQGDGGGQ